MSFKHGTHTLRKCPAWQQSKRFCCCCGTVDTLKLFVRGSVPVVNLTKCLRPPRWTGCQSAAQSGAMPPTRGLRMQLLGLIRRSELPNQQNADVLTDACR
jgi:hypothetical protein